MLRSFGFRHDNFDGEQSDISLTFSGWLKHIITSTEMLNELNLGKLDKKTNMLEQFWPILRKITCIFFSSRFSTAFGILCVIAKTEFDEWAPIGQVQGLLFRLRRRVTQYLCSLNGFFFRKKFDFLSRNVFTEFTFILSGRFYFELNKA